MSSHHTFAHVWVLVYAYVCMSPTATLYSCFFCSWNVLSSQTLCFYLDLHFILHNYYNHFVFFLSFGVYFFNLMHSVIVEFTNKIFSLLPLYCLSLSVSMSSDKNLSDTTLQLFIRFERYRVLAGSFYRDTENTIIWIIKYFVNKPVLIIFTVMLGYIFLIYTINYISLKEWMLKGLRELGNTAQHW